MKAGEKVLILATVTQDPNGNLIRCQTKDTGTIVWASADEIAIIEDDAVIDDEEETKQGK